MDQFVIERGNGRIEEYYRAMPAAPGSPARFRWTTNQSHAQRFDTRESAAATAKALVENFELGSV